jgi:hypothetical protein
MRLALWHARLLARNEAVVGVLPRRTMATVSTVFQRIGAADLADMLRQPQASVAVVDVRDDGRLTSTWIVLRPLTRQNVH